MAYAIAMLRAAQRQLAKIDTEERGRILTAVRALGESPRPPGTRKLTGRDAWRIRVGNFRVIYEIDDAKQSIVVVVVGHRRDIYRP